MIVGGWSQAMESLGAGWLPKWLLLISVTSIANSVQAYVTDANVARVYPGSSSVSMRQARSGRTAIGGQKSTSDGPSQSPVTSLSARTFGTWTLLSGIIRAYAAFNIHDKLVYELALWSYVVVVLHFGSEWFIYGTTRWGKGLAGPALVGSCTLVWMLMQWDFYA